MADMCDLPVGQNRWGRRVSQVLNRSYGLPYSALRLKRATCALGERRITLEFIAGRVVGATVGKSVPRAGRMSLLNTPFDPAREAALVTGAGNGIGRAIAQALVGEGVRTVFADVNPDTVAASVKASPRPELAVPWV